MTGAILFWLALLGSTLVCIPAMLVLAQAVAASPALLRRSAMPDAAAPRPSVAVLVPAHDEEAGIADALTTVRPQLRRSDRLLVVADNCGDATAVVARDFGAEVVERCDPQRRGKGWALDFGVRALSRDPREVVVVVDADCRLGPGAIDALASACAMSGAPAQALYLMEVPPGGSLLTRVAAFAWIVKNEVRPLGGHRLGMPCGLMGTGMAFPWALLRDAPLASGHLVEDMQLGLALAIRGTPPRFIPEALVTSVFPSDVDALTSQRRRWEHGHFSLIASTLPALIRAAVLRRRPGLLAMAADLAVPPLASLVLSILATIGFGSVVAVLFGPIVPLIVSLAAGAAMIVAVGIAWHRFGRNVLSPTQWLAIPGYVFGKVPMYANLFWRRQIEWVRTERDRRE